MNFTYFLGHRENMNEGLHYIFKVVEDIKMTKMGYSEHHVLYYYSKNTTVFENSEIKVIRLYKTRAKYRSCYFRH